MNDPLGGLSPQSPRDEDPAAPAAGEPPAPRALPATSTVVLLVLIAAGFIAQGLIVYPRPGWWSFTDSEATLRLGSLFAPAVRDGDWWRIGSYAFLHGGLAHLLMNSAALWVLMRPIEGAYGSVAAIGLFSAGALAGGAASCAMKLANVSAMPSVGASGGAFAMFGATAAVWFRIRHRVSPEVLRAVRRDLLFNLLINVAIAVAARDILDHWAHLGGFAAGLLLGLLAPLPIDRGKPHHFLAQTALVCAAFVLAAAEGAAIARAVAPKARRFEAPGIEARLPWYMAPLRGDIFAAPDALGMRGFVRRWTAPDVQGAQTAFLGPRRFHQWQGKPEGDPALGDCPHAAQLVSQDEDKLHVAVCCFLGRCVGTSAEAARFIASTARATQ